MRFRHRNWPDHLYEIDGEGVVQAREPLREGEAVMVYRNIHDGRIWVRRKTEFFDGRFSAVDDA